MKKEKKTCSAPNFKELDSLIRMKFRDERYASLEDLGYDYLSEAVHDLYYGENKSITQTGAFLGCSHTAIAYLMKIWGFKRRPVGGNTKNPRLSDPVLRKKILRMKGRMAPKAAAKKFECSQSFIRGLWKVAA